MADTKTITNSFLKLVIDQDLRGLDNIFRYSKMALIHKESVSQHSYWVTFFSFLLGDILLGEREEKKFALIKYAMFHDFDEIFTGDLTHDFKYDSDNGLNLVTLRNYCEKKMETKFGDCFKFSDKILSGVDEEVKSICKIADWFSIIQFLNNEMLLGNRADKIKKVFYYSLDSVANRIDVHISNFLNDSGDEKERQYLNSLKIQLELMKD